MYSATRVSIAFPAGGDAEGHQAGGQHHEQHGNAVHAHVIGDAAAQPVQLLDQLEAGIGGIELRPHHQRQREGRRWWCPARSSAPLSALRQQQDGQRAQQRHEGDKGKNGKAHSAPPDSHEPGGQRHHAQQHRQGIVIDIAGLQPDRAARRIQHPGGDAVGPQPVDHRAVAALPQEAAQPQGRAHEQEVIQLVEIPFVVEEQVEHAPAAPRASRQVGMQDVIIDRRSGSR